MRINPTHIPFIIVGAAIGWTAYQVEKAAAKVIFR